MSSGVFKTCLYIQTQFYTIFLSLLNVLLLPPSIALFCLHLIFCLYMYNQLTFCQTFPAAILKVNKDMIGQDTGYIHVIEIVNKSNPVPSYPILSHPYDIMQAIRFKFKFQSGFSKRNFFFKFCLLYKVKHYKNINVICLQRGKEK